MPTRPHSRSRIRTRAAARTTRRLSPCYRHSDDPSTGICASCLRERLSGLDGSPPPNAASPELRRSRSVVSTSRCEASSSTMSEPRRKSCDVVSSRGSLSTLFDVDDLKSGSESGAKVESKNVGLARVTYTVIEPRKKNPDQVRVSNDGFGGLNADSANSDEEVKEGEFKSMKEYIDLEFGNKSKKTKDFRHIAGNIFGAASVFSKKLRKWRQKNSKIKETKNITSGNVLAGNDGRKWEENHSEILGRRSCDIEPRFSVDGGRISFEEPRASWDGYMIARTIPRLTPMFSVVENGILGNASRFENHRLSVDGPMHSIIEDESSSGASGSGHSNSDSSSSMRRSSFDRSSSVRSFGKKGINPEDHGVSSPANVKLVITEKELKDWRLRSSRDDVLEKLGSTPRYAAAAAVAAEVVGNLNASTKKSVRWRKVCNVLGFRNKNGENVADTFRTESVTSMDDAREKQEREATELVRDVGDWKLARSSSVVASRKSCDVPGSYYARRSVDNAGGFTLNVKEDFKLERNRSAKFASVDLDSGVKPFYMTPLRSMRNSKSGKFKFQNSHSTAGNLLQLN